jgi:hypothetical protein
VSPERERPGRKRSGSTAGPGQVSPERERPVRDQGGIKAGPRRDHTLFHLFVTDYQLLNSLVFLYFFELQALALYQSSELLSKRLGEIYYARIYARAAASTAAPPFRDDYSRTLPVAYSSISVDYLKPYGDRNWFYFLFSPVCGGVRTAPCTYCLFPPPAIGMLATYH